MFIKKKTLNIFLLLTVFIAVSAIVSSIPSATLINYVGSNNAFALMFVLGLAGGLTTFTGIPYHFVLMSLAAGGINPLGLGLSTALGVMVGDSSMFYITNRVKNNLSHKILGRIGTWAKSLNKHPYLITPSLIAYGAVSPFSNDFIVASLGIMGYSFKRIIIPLAIGNIIFNVAIAYVGLYAYDTIVIWL
jgi:membrane protein DedA with SNARE-associated domain